MAAFSLSDLRQLILQMGSPTLCLALPEKK